MNEVDLSAIFQRRNPLVDYLLRQIRQVKVSSEGYNLEITLTNIEARLKTIDRPSPV
jgi:hypothetical protein